MQACSLQTRISTRCWDLIAIAPFSKSATLIAFSRSVIIPNPNCGTEKAQARTQSLNAAYETLSDPARRRAYDRELDRVSQAAVPRRATRIERNITEEVRLRIEDFLRGTTVDVRVNDPANSEGVETYRVRLQPLPHRALYDESRDTRAASSCCA